MVKQSIIVLLFLLPFLTFSQITIGSVEKIEVEKIEPKPTQYDSINDFKIQENLIDNKMYIGLKFYLPTYNNSTSKEYTGKSYPFMFSDSLSKVNIEPQNSLKKASNNEYYENIYTYKYKPFHYFSGIVNGDAYASITTNADEVSNKYYTVIDVFTGEEKKNILKNISILINKKNDNYNDYIDDVGFNNYDIYEMSRTIFKIQDDITKEHIYVFDLNPFILVPYFVKQKELFNSKKFIALVLEDNFETTDFSKNEKIKIENKSVWNCEVSLLSKKEILAKDLKLKLGSYFVAYKMTNDKGQVIIFKGLNSNSIKFKIFEEYISEENDKKLKQELIIERNKKQKKLESDKLIAKQIAYKNKCISMFGTNYGELIYQEKVTIGMTKEMCEMAWGNPYDKSVTILENITFEHWYYSWKKSLHFENGKLTRIEK